MSLRPLRLRRAALAGILALLVSQGPAAPRAASGPARLGVDHRAFTAEGRRFAWRGLTSFQLLEMVAHGRLVEAERLLDWARRQGITVVRVLAMADVLFRLPPAEGRAALPRLLSLAAGRGLYVEVVALADTNRVEGDLPAQVRAVGAICAQHANCVLEIANEPWTRHTQRADLGDPQRLFAMRRLVPLVVPVSIGAGPSDHDDGWALGDYVTVHLWRKPGWESVLRMREAEALSRRTGKPVVDDEPIGAGPRYERERRDDDPSRWRARGLLARVMGLGATFHYQAGLHSVVPEGQEARCFEAWRQGLDALPADLETRATFHEVGAEGAAVGSFDRSTALAAYLAQDAREAWAVAVDVRGDPRLEWREGWRVVAMESDGAVRMYRARRTP